ncbi:MAG TPA: NADH-quinone oxidoreductase subunit C [Acidimicrobiales bacterium]|nr:NADH-quinone oxidoreductase subunit C [Acidimicrobiales bacterium]
MSSAEPGNGATGASTNTEDRQQALLEDLTARLGDDIVGSHVHSGDLWVRVRPEAWVRAAEECKAIGFDYFCYLSGIDWMPHTWPNPKVIEGADGDTAGVVDREGEDEGTEASPPEAQAGFESDEPADPSAGIVTGFAGGDTRFQVIARLYSIVRHIGVHLKADLDDDDPRIRTWTGVYAGADWCERETWEMYGFTFDGHPNLTHLYLPGEFEGFPLRKDFPLLAREVKPWPGLVDVEQFPATYQGDD